MWVIKSGLWTHMDRQLCEVYGKHTHNTSIMRSVAESIVRTHGHDADLYGKDLSTITLSQDITAGSIEGPFAVV